MIYRNSYYTDVEGHAGYEFFSSKRDAEREFNRRVKEGNCDPVSGGLSNRAEPVEFRATKAGIIRILNSYAGHNNNG